MQLKKLKFLLFILMLSYVTGIFNVLQFLFYYLQKIINNSAMLNTRKLYFNMFSILEHANNLLQESMTNIFIKLYI